LVKIKVTGYYHTSSLQGWLIQTRSKTYAGGPRVVSLCEPEVADLVAEQKSVSDPVCGYSPPSTQSCNHYIG